MSHCGLHKWYVKSFTGLAVRPVSLSANLLFIWGVGHFVVDSLHTAIYCKFYAAILVRTENAPF